MRLGIMKIKISIISLLFSFILGFSQNHDSLDSSFAVQDIPEITLMKSSDSAEIVDQPESFDIFPKTCMTPPNTFDVVASPLSI